MDLISVIVPVYNVDKYLPSCLDSILASTYENLEIIVVDDGSPDNCPRICDAYAQKDPRIKVIHQENQGLVGARNTGLSAAHGAYITFVDSDDAVSPLFVELLADTLIKTGADAVGCEACRDPEDLATSMPETVETHTAHTYAQKLSLITSAPSVRSISWTGCSVWNKLYAADKIKHAFRREYLMCEDLGFNWDFIKYCEKLVTIPVPLYYYRQNPSGIMGSYLSNRSKLRYGLCHANLWAEIAEQPTGDDLLNRFLCARAAYMMHGALWRICMCGSHREYQSEIRTGRALIRRYFDAFRRDRKSYNLKIRLIVALCNYAYPLWSALALLLGLLGKR